MYSWNDTPVTQMVVFDSSCKNIFRETKARVFQTFHKRGRKLAYWNNNRSNFDFHPFLVLPDFAPDDSDEFESKEWQMPLEDDISDFLIFLALFHLNPSGVLMLVL